MKAVQWHHDTSMFHDLLAPVLLMDGVHRCHPWILVFYGEDWHQLKSMAIPVHLYRLWTFLAGLVRYITYAKHQVEIQRENELYLVQYPRQ